METESPTESNQLSTNELVEGSTDTNHGRLRRQATGEDELKKDIEKLKERAPNILNNTKEVLSKDNVAVEVIKEEEE